MNKKNIGAIAITDHDTVEGLKLIDSLLGQNCFIVLRPMKAYEEPSKPSTPEPSTPVTPEPSTPVTPTTPETPKPEPSTPTTPSEPTPEDPKPEEPTPVLEPNDPKEASDFMIFVKDMNELGAPKEQIKQNIYSLDEEYKYNEDLKKIINNILESI